MISPENGPKVLRALRFKRQGKVRSLIVLLFAMAADGCSADGNRAAQFDDIREATFRYLFVKNASGLQQNAKVYFLSLLDPVKKQHEDPADGFMARFAGHHPRVAKASAANSAGITGVQDKQTGEHGLIFHLGDIRWISDTAVEVDGSYYEASESAAGSTYYLKKQEGRWVVQRDVMHWIK